MPDRLVLGFLGSTRFGSGFSARLLLRLALAGDAGCSRDALVSAFWPGIEFRIARPRLRQALLRARTSLTEAGIDPCVILAEPDHLRFAPESVTTDIAVFREVIRQRNWSHADTVYVGDLMPGVSDPVISPERDSLRKAYLQVLRELSGQHEMAGEFTRALQAAVRYAALEPFEVEIALRVLRLMLRAGHLQAARNQYRTLRQNQKSGDSERLTASQRDQVRQWFGPALRDARARLSPAVRTSIRSPSLPPILNRFFGREREIREVTALLGSHENRLVTLIGPAGSGKTRLAVEVARARETDEDVFFVGLADITEPYQFGGKIIRALSVPRNPAQTAMVQTVEILNRRESPTLLILDNLEHLLHHPEIRGEIQTLLSEVPRLRLLTTSRQKLQVDGEQEIAVAPLPIPRTDDEESPAVALFTDRMQAVRPEFRLTEGNAASVAALCRSLDGLPLALEIVATWAKTLTPMQMLDQMKRAERRPALLTSRRPRAFDSARHLSLQAAIAWSYDSLPPEIRRFFAGLQVFRGGFTAEAAADICREPSAAAFLEVLRERSFVTVSERTTAGGAVLPRFRILETLREFGREQTSAAETDTLRLRHAAYYASFAERAEREMLRPDQTLWNERLRDDLDNIRAVAASCRMSRIPVTLGLRLGGALWRFLSMSHYVREGREFLQDILSLVPPSAENEPFPGRAKALFALSNLSFYQGDAPAGIRYARESVAVPALPEDAWIRAFAQTWLGVMLFLCGSFDDARRELEIGLAASRVVGDDWLVGYALMQSALLGVFTGCYENVLAYSEESLQRVDRIGEKVLAGLNYVVLGLYHYYVQQDAERSEAFCRRSLENFAATEDIWLAALGRCQFGLILTREGRYAEAEALHRESSRSYEALGDPHGLAQGLEGLGETAAAQNDFLRAARFWGAADERRRRCGIAVWPFLLPYRETLLAKTRAALGTDAFSVAFEQGRSLPLETLLFHNTAEISVS